MPKNAANVQHPQSRAPIKRALSRKPKALAERDLICFYSGKKRTTDSINLGWVGRC